jgi:hypothetical protein
MPALEPLAIATLLLAPRLAPARDAPLVAFNLFRCSGASAARAGRYYDCIPDFAIHLQDKSPLPLHSYTNSIEDMDHIVYQWAGPLSCREPLGSTEAQQAFAAISSHGQILQGVTPCYARMAMPVNLHHGSYDEIMGEYKALLAIPLFSQWQYTSVARNACEGLFRSLFEIASHRSPEQRSSCGSVTVSGLILSRDYVFVISLAVSPNNRSASPSMSYVGRLFSENHRLDESVMHSLTSHLKESFAAFRQFRPSSVPPPVTAWGVRAPFISLCREALALRTSSDSAETRGDAEEGPALPAPHVGTMSIAGQRYMGLIPVGPNVDVVLELDMPREPMIAEYVLLSPENGLTPEPNSFEAPRSSTTPSACCSSMHVLAAVFHVIDRT